MGKILIAKNLNKKYDYIQALNNVSFYVEKGEFLSILGSSGCGKTTLLRTIIGIEQLDSGKVLKGNRDITNLAPSARKMGIVFQNYALFPNMTVLKNITYPLRANGINAKAADKKARKIIDKVGLTNFIDRKPAELSGGQQQRVAIARTLVLKPDIILFDESMSALDASMKIELRKEIKSMQKEYNITIIYITHDQEEAFAMSDRIMVMDKGEVIQIDTPFNIYNNPKNNFVKSFIVDHLNNQISSITSSIGGLNGKKK